ncbi:hypothetical protein CC86DRAFT_16443 [Ophiobolus disseminans]|uniref:Uncharacterized protein n=1 Tax=Ophiobolus disseminans TaxID=1469910 RepID=A0A6A7AMQ4_9PLEO|nr:hypothetical protein CC86DRAFT_16443 [Ophiobolus disseminans]
MTSSGNESFVCRSQQPPGLGIPSRPYHWPFYELHGRRTRDAPLHTTSSYLYVRHPLAANSLTSSQRSQAFTFRHSTSSPAIRFRKDATTYTPEPYLNRTSAWPTESWTFWLCWSNRFGDDARLANFNKLLRRWLSASARSHTEVDSYCGGC